MKKNEKKQKKIKYLYLLLIIILLMTGCNTKEQSLTDKEKFKQEYESLNGEKREKDGRVIRTVSIKEDNPMKYATANNIVEKIENQETFVVYFGFADCPWCRSMIETLIDVALELDVSEIYYVDIKNIRDTITIDEDGNLNQEKGSNGYHQLLEKLNPVLSEYKIQDKDDNEVDTNEKRIYAPNVVAIKKGTPIKLTSATSEKQTEGYMELTSEMKEDMKEKIKCVLECTKEDKELCENNEKC